MNQTIFRKEALSRLASPEQLDQLMPLTRPRGWMALATAALVLLAGLLWALFGSVAIKVKGQGVLYRPGGVQEVAVPGVPGPVARVTRVKVRPGDAVRAGQELLHLSPALGDPSGLVVSPKAGRISDVFVLPGDSVRQSAPLVSIESLDQPLLAVLFLPAADGYRVQAGMKVQITPVSGGALIGQVKSAERTLADRASMLRILGSEDLVNAVVQAGPCLEIVVELDPGTAAVQKELYSGTPCQAQITIEEHPPIKLFLPSAGTSQGSK